MSQYNIDAWIYEQKIINNKGCAPLKLTYLSHPPISLHDNGFRPDLIVYRVPLLEDLLDVILKIYHGLSKYSYIVLTACLLSSKKMGL